MTIDAAVIQLKIYVPAAEDPEVSDAELGIIVGQLAVVDADGYMPSDALWTGTYDINQAVVEVWKIKAARTARKITFSADDAKFELGQRHRQFLRMADEARRKCAVSF